MCVYSNSSSSGGSGQTQEFGNKVLFKYKLSLLLQRKKSFEVGFSRISFSSSLCGLIGWKMIWNMIDSRDFHYRDENYLSNNWTILQIGVLELLIFMLQLFVFHSIMTPISRFPLLHLCPRTLWWDTHPLIIKSREVSQQMIRSGHKQMKLSCLATDGERLSGTNQFKLSSYGSPLILR